jgi:hypothetical protein
MEQTNDRELLEAAARDEALARRMAHILGQSSAAQQAIDAAEQSRANGIPAAVIQHGRTWVVVRAAAAIATAENGNMPD